MLEQRSKKMAMRLKELRKQYHLSHDKLASALQEKYNISISKDSLVGYEAPHEGHTRFGSNLRMRAEYIICLADFFGVTTDYLLINTDDPAIKPSIRNETGLSAEAIQYLSVSKDKQGNENNSCFIINSLFKTYDGVLCEALGKKSPYNSNKERYEWVASYLSACPLGLAISHETLLLRDIKYGHTNPNIDTTLLYEYNASTTLSKHCEAYAHEVWSDLSKELKTHYKYNK